MLLVASKEENEIFHILNGFIYFNFIIYFIVCILDHVDHEDLPRHVFVCGTV